MKSLIVILTIVIFSCKPSTDASSTTALSPIDLNQPDGGTDPQSNPIMGGPTELKITLTESNVNGLARIIGFYNDQNFVIDTFAINGGKGQYKKQEGLPQGLYYIMFPNEAVLQVILDHDQEMEVSTNLSDIVNTTKFIGSTDNDLMYEVYKYEESFNPKIQSVIDKIKGVNEGSAEFNKLRDERAALENEKSDYIQTLYQNNPNSLFAAFKYGGQNPTLNPALSKDAQLMDYRNRFWDNVNFNDRRLLRTPIIGNKLKRYIKELVPQNQDSIIKYAFQLTDKVIDKKEYFKVIANYIVLQYEPGKSSLMDAEAVFVHMVKRYFTPERAFWSDSTQTALIQKRAFEMEASLLNKKAPNVLSVGPDGTKHELYKMTADYLIVYMFNPDCEHCQEETPKLLKYYQNNKGKIDVYGIAVDTDEDKWINYIKKLNLNWTNVYDPTNRTIYAKYFVDHTPEVYVLNKDRIIIGKNLKVDQIQTVIDRDKEKRK
ncbi:MAG: thioredoxin-like domain-containing protein [Saprospiraceae bacterium]